MADDEPQASVFGTSFNIISNVVGGGCLLLPSVMHAASLIPGIISLILMAILAILSVFYMILCCEKTRRFTYKDLLTVAISPRAAYWFDLILFLYTYLILVGWAKIIVDSMPPVAEQFFGLADTNAFASKWFWLLAAFFIFFPLSSLKQLAHLQWTSLAGFLTILYVALVMFGRLVDGYYTNKWDPAHSFPCSTWNESFYADNPTAPIPQTSTAHDNVKLVDITFQLVSAFPQISVAYSCHYNIPPYYGELRRRTPMRMIRAAGIAYGTIVSFYVLVGVVGVLTFGDGITQSKGDLVKCYSYQDTPLNIGRTLLFVHFCMVYPLVAIAVRRFFNGLVFPHKHLEHWHLILEAFFLVLSTCILAYFVPGLGIVFTLAGAFFGLSIVFVIPGLFYWQIFSDGFDENFLLQHNSQHSGGGDSNQAESLQTQPNHHNNNDDQDFNDNNSYNENIHAVPGHVHIEPEGPHYVTDDANVRNDQGYGTVSETDVANSAHRTSGAGGANKINEAGGMGGISGDDVAVTESEPTEWDTMIAELVRTPNNTLRGLAMFSMVFGILASILSIVNAFRDIADGKNTG